MPLVCKFLSVPALLVAVVGLAGCYDLSDPSGPRPEDFARGNDTTEQKQQEQDQAKDLSTGAAPEARAAATSLEDDVGALLARPQRANKAQRKLRASTEDRD